MKPPLYKYRAAVVVVAEPSPHAGGTGKALAVVHQEPDGTRLVITDPTEVIAESTNPQRRSMSLFAMPEPTTWRHCRLTIRRPSYSTVIDLGDLYNLPLDTYESGFVILIRGRGEGFDAAAVALDYLDGVSSAARHSWRTRPPNP